MSCESNKSPITERMWRFIECQSVACKESTLSTYRISLRHLSRFLTDRGKSAENDLKNITGADLTDFLCELNRKNLVPYTKLNYMINVRHYLAWEAEQKNIDPELIKTLDRSKLPKVPEYLPKPLSSENDLEFQRRCSTSRSPYALMFLLLRHTGMRISELVNLPFNPVIDHNGAKFIKVPLGKMYTERMVPLSIETYNVICKIQAAYPILLNRENKDRLVGIAGSVDAVKKHLVCHFKELTVGIIDQNKNITFHRLRHTYATTLLTAGVSIVSIMKLLGHRRIEMSLRYAKVTPMHLRNEYLKAIAIIENQTGLKTNEIATHTSEYHPAEIIRRLRAFTNQSAKIPPPRKKKILRKLARIKTDFDAIDFVKSFKIAK